MLASGQRVSAYVRLEDLGCRSSLDGNHYTVLT